MDEKEKIDMSDPRLEPCSCGCTELALFSPAVHINDDYWVACDDCENESNPYQTEQEAIDDWNNMMRKNSVKTKNHCKGET